MKTHSTKQFLVQIKDLSKIYFSKCTAPKTVLENFKYTDPEKGKILTHVGYAEEQPVTLSRLFSPTEDQDLIDFCAKAKKGEQDPFTVSIQPVKVNADGSALPGARTLILTNCQVLSITYPGADRESNNPAMLEIELVPEEVNFQ